MVDVRKSPSELAVSPHWRAQLPRRAAASSGSVGEGQERLPADGGYVLAANHISNADPWPLGMALFPRRYLRFMAKSELFWFPLGPFIKACGAFPVRRGQHDLEAVETAIQLCREGHVVVMFPEGTRREKGLRKRHEARWRSGAARIALEAGVPLVPAGISRDGRVEPPAGAARRVRGPDPARRPGGHAARRRSAGGNGSAQRQDRRARGDASVKPLLAVDGDSFAHRAFHALPRSFRRDDGGPANALIGFMSMLLRLWQAEQPRAVVVGWDTLFVPTYRNELLVDLPVRTGVRPRDPRPARPAAGARLVDRDRLRQERGIRGRRLPRGGGRVRARTRRHDARRDLGSRRVPARGRRRHDPAAGSRRQRAAAHRAGRGA